MKKIILIVLLACFIVLATASISPKKGACQIIFTAKNEISGVSVFKQTRCYYSDGINTDNTKLYKVFTNQYIEKK